ncbi:unnamed protein product, partial [Mesorhabditis belari]|uniref:F-box domain-containing protein n=1 Tax=Mesorhabditis belari TaxID=2138241 RepID=A0A915GYS5_9BILA
MTFTYTKLPPELQKCVLNSTTLSEIPKLLQSNKTNRELIRKKPFSTKKIDSIEVKIPIYGITVDDSVISEVNFLVSFQNLDLIFRLTNNVIHLADLQLSISNQHFWALLKDVVALKTLHLHCLPHFGTSEMAEKEFEHLLDAKTFLPNLKYVNAFEITTNSSKFLNICYTKLKIDGFNRIQLRIDRSSGDWKKCLGKLFDESLQQCPTLTWASQKTPWKQLSQLNLRLLTLETFDGMWKKFVQLIRDVHKNQIDFDTVTMVGAKYFSNETIDDLFVELQDIFKPIAGLKRIGGGSQKGALLVERLRNLSVDLEKMRIQDHPLLLDIRDQKRKNFFYQKTISNDVDVAGCASLFQSSVPGKKGSQFIYQIFTIYLSCG